MEFRNALDVVLSGTVQPCMHYQPIVDLKRSVVVGYEALVRFPAPPQLPPDQWFRSAYERNKGVRLESLVTKLALQGRDVLPPNTFLTVNLSPVFVMSDECMMLLEAEGDLSRIVFEITEGDRIHDYASFRERLARVRELGGGIAVDDTGSGYASLKHVMELRPQFVKLDRFFIEGCQMEPAKSAFIHTIGEAADRMDAWLIAEGIENEPELHELMRQTVPLGQGYYLGRPDPVMKPPTEAAVVSIQSRVSPSSSKGLWRLLESAVPCNTREEAEAAVLASTHGVSAVVLDEWKRPLHLVECHPLLGMRQLPVVMRASVDSGTTELLRRAISRPLAQRFDPVVVIGENGEYLGLVRVDHLTQSLLA